jgi:prevent-host-death family protein
MSAPANKPANPRKVRRISATELSRHLSRVLSRVHDRGETVIVERNGKPLCQVAPIEEGREFTLADLGRLLAEQPLGRDWADAVAEGIANQDVYEPPKWSR